MSALGQSRHFEREQATSAFHPTPDIALRRSANGLGPKQITATGGKRRDILNFAWFESDNYCGSGDCEGPHVGSHFENL